MLEACERFEAFVHCLHAFNKNTKNTPLLFIQHFFVNAWKILSFWKIQNNALKSSSSHIESKPKCICKLVYAKTILQTTALDSNWVCARAQMCTGACARFALCIYGHSSLNGCFMLLLLENGYSHTHKGNL